MSTRAAVASTSYASVEAGPSSPKAAALDMGEFIQFPESDEDEEQNEVDHDDEADNDDSDSSEDSSEEDSEASEDEDESDEGSESASSITSERLNALLERAKERERQEKAEKGIFDEDVVKLSDDRPLPNLDASSLLPKHFTAPPNKQELPKLAVDLGAERVSAAAAQKRKADPEVGAPVERLTKKQKRELREKTAGPDWFDMPSPSGTELAKIKREMEAARLAAALDPKTFLRKEAMKEEVPKYVQLGKIVATKSPFERPSKKNLTRAERKKSIVDELVEDTEAKAYAKRKFLELQGVRGEKGKLTMRRRQELRAARRKW